MMRREADQRAEQGRGRSSKTESHQADTVSLSEASRRVGEEAEGVREDLVNQIKEKIRAGAYRPDIRRAAYNLVHDDTTPLI